MRVTIVPSSVSPTESVRQQFLTSYLVNQAVAIDAGSVGLFRTPREQARIKHVFLSHTHMDHLASLPALLDNAYRGDGDCITVYGSEAVLDCLQRDLFNDRLWPDLVRISVQRPPYLRLRQLHAGQTVTCAGLRVTPVPVNHAVPTFGFVVEDARAAVVFPSDTGPTEAIWERANACPHLKAVFLESTFPNEMAWLADLAAHLTPERLAQELQKLKHPVRVIAIHLSPRLRQKIGKELRALDLANVEIGRFGVPYRF